VGTKKANAKQREESYKGGNPEKKKQPLTPKSSRLGRASQVRGVANQRMQQGSGPSAEEKLGKKKGKTERKGRRVLAMFVRSARGYVPKNN